MGFVMSLSSKSGFLYEKMITVGFYCDICFPGTDSGRIDQHKMDREWVANVSRSLKFGPAPVAYVSNEDDMIDPSMIQYRNRLKMRLRFPFQNRRQQ